MLTIISNILLFCPLALLSQVLTTPIAFTISIYLKKTIYQTVG